MASTAIVLAPATPSLAKKLEGPAAVGAGAAVGAMVIGGLKGALLGGAGGVALAALVAMQRGRSLASMFSFAGEAPDPFNFGDDGDMTADDVLPGDLPGDDTSTMAYAVDTDPYAIGQNLGGIGDADEDTSDMMQNDGDDDGSGWSDDTDYSSGAVEVVQDAGGYDDGTSYADSSYDGGGAGDSGGVSGGGAVQQGAPQQAASQQMPPTPSRIPATPVAPALSTAPGAAQIAMAATPTPRRSHVIALPHSTPEAAPVLSAPTGYAGHPLASAAPSPPRPAAPPPPPRPGPPAPPRRVAAVRPPSGVHR